MFYKPGDPFIAKNTTMNRRCGVAERATGHVTHINADDNTISFYLDKGVGSSGWIEACASGDEFAANFEPDFLIANNAGYVQSKPFVKKHPDDCY